MTEDEHADELDASAQYRVLAAVVTDVIVTIDERSTIRFVNEAAEDVFGYAPGELTGRSLTLLMDDRQADRHEAGLDRYLRTGERNLDWGYIELAGRHRDGSTVPLGVSFSEFEIDGERLFTGIVRDISDQKAWERKLTRLNELSQSLADRSSEEGVWDSLLGAATELFSPHEVGLVAFDSETGSLEPVGSSADDPPGEGILSNFAGLAWNAFTANETLVLDRADGSIPADVAYEHVHVQPLGQYGVLVAASSRGEGSISAAASAEIAGLIADRATTAFDRIGRERDLKERNSRLAEQNATLERVSRLNDIIRRLTAALVDATTRDEVERLVCRELTDGAPFEFAWFGRPNQVSGGYEVRASSGDDRGTLDDLAVPTDVSGSDPGPTERAVETREVHVESELHTTPPYGAWRSGALERGFRAIAAVPIDHETAQFGVLTLYADTADAFGEVEEAVLAELGEMIGYAINAVERRNALLDEGAVELEFRIGGTDNEVIRFVGETGATFTFESVISEPDGGLRAYFVIAGVDPETTREFAARSPTVTRINLVSSDPDTEEYLYEAWITSDGHLGTLLELNAVPREITVTGDEAWFTVEVPRSVDVREFVGALERLYDGIDLVARRERDRPIQTRQEFRARLEERLTNRQLRALETAFWSGYFDWPRARTGAEIAETLDISQPTFTRHLRRGERKLLSLLFEGVDRPSTHG